MCITETLMSSRNYYNIVHLLFLSDFFKIKDGKLL